MKPLAAARLLAALLLAPLPDLAQQKPEKIEVITPIFHQLVAYNIPSTFNVTNPDHQNANFYIHEIVPFGQTVEQWKQMITVTGNRGGSGKTETGYIDTLAAGYQRSCPQTFALKRVATTTISGAPAAIAVISCGSVADEHGSPGAVHSETALVVAIAGDQDMYSLQWAERATASSKPLALDGTTWSDRFKALGPIRICPRVEGEKEPYPSCIGN